MPTNPRVTREMIIEAGLELVRNDGIESLSNRELAKKLNCSIRPIYYQFENSEELKDAIMERMTRYFYDFLNKNMIEGVAPYKQVGLNYIRFSREEKNLFKALFLSGTPETGNDYLFQEEEGFDEVKEAIIASTHLDEKKINSFHSMMWYYTHGLATLIANHTLELTDQQIQDLLTKQFQALMMLETDQNMK